MGDDIDILTFDYLNYDPKVWSDYFDISELFHKSVCYTKFSATHSQASVEKNFKLLEAKILSIEKQSKKQSLFERLSFFYNLLSLRSLNSLTNGTAHCHFFPRHLIARFPHFPGWLLDDSAEHAERHSAGSRRSAPSEDWRIRVIRAPEAPIWNFVRSPQREGFHWRTGEPIASAIQPVGRWRTEQRRREYVDGWLMTNSQWECLRKALMICWDRRSMPV